MKANTIRMDLRYQCFGEGIPMSKSVIVRLDLGNNLDGAIDGVEEIQTLSLMLRGCESGTFEASAVAAIGRMIESAVASVANLTDWLRNETTSGLAKPL